MQLTYMLAMAASIATAAALPSLQKRALACPASNNTVYSTPNGKQYTIECGLDRVGADYGMSYVTTLENCLLACSLNPICMDVSFIPGSVVGPCYLKTAVNTASTNGNVMGARLGTGSLGSSSSSTSSASSSSTTASSASSASSTSTTASSASSTSSTSTTASSTSSASSTSTTASTSKGSTTSVAAAAAATSSTTAVSSAQSSTGTATSANVVSSVVSAVSAAATGAQTCDASISAIAEYPHMVVRVSKLNPLQGYPQAWNGTMNSDLDSIFNFDIKPSYAGKSCTLFFLPPTSDQLSSAGFPWGVSGTGSIAVSRLASSVTENIPLASLPLQSTVGAITSLATGNNAVVYSTLCPAGERMSFRFTTLGSLALDYYQYVLPYSIGVYMSVC